MAQSRQTAFKIRIYDIKNNKYVKGAGDWDPNYIQINENQISRVNLIANVVMKNDNEEKTYSSIVLDDGTETINVKCWREDTKRLENINVGDIILLIGRIREFNDEIYVTPEIVKQTNFDWALVRKQELEKLYGPFIENEKNYSKIIKEEKTENPDYVNVTEEKVENNLVESKRQKILTLIEKFDTNSGADILQVIEESKFDKKEANDIIDELIKEGEIFQIKVGRLKLIN